MKLFLRLLCLLLVATAALAESPAYSSPDNDLPAAVSSKPSAAVANEPPEAPELQIRPAQHDTVLPAATVLRVKLTQNISTASARVGQRFQAALSQPVEAEGQVFLPAGSLIDCRVDRAQGVRRFHGKPLLAIKAIGVHLPDGNLLAFNATVVDTSNPHHLNVDEGGRVRGADSNPMNKVESVALGGSGAVAGIIMAGPQGMLIGAGTGVAIAAGHILVKHRELTLTAGTELIFELDAPATYANHGSDGTIAGSSAGSSSGTM
jgi:hypothetical protein